MISRISQKIIKTFLNCSKFSKKILQKFSQKQSWFYAFHDSYFVFEPQVESGKLHTKKDHNFN